MKPDEFLACASKVNDPLTFCKTPTGRHAKFTNAAAPTTHGSGCAAEQQRAGRLCRPHGEPSRIKSRPRRVMRGTSSLSTGGGLGSRLFSQ